VDSTDQIISRYSPIYLQEAESIKLFNRIDSKYILNSDLLPKLLDALQKDYRILDVQGQRNQSYQSLYFDTAGKNMYFAHHNGIQPRYKVRFREYKSSKAIFLEIKNKTNKGRTLKWRMHVDTIPSSLSESMQVFIANHIPYDPGMLIPQIYTDFNRITLIENNLKERVTIDTAISFKDENKTIYIPSLVIIEIKRELGHQGSSIERLLHTYHVKPKSASKYCLGIVLLTVGIKRNLFKPTILLINKLCPNEFTSDLIANAG
jgi:hypothetical protein